MREYCSVYGPVIERFIAFKRGLGYKFDHAESVLGRFDAFCASRGEASIGVTAELAEAWGRKRDNESDPTRYSRVHYLIQLASFLNDIGYPSYIPRPPADYSSTFTPHIFSHEELARLFPAIDAVCAESRPTPVSCAHAAPAIVRLLYGTGARIGEACSLKGGDVDLDRGKLLLRWTKNGQERVLPMSSSLTRVLEEYASSRRRDHGPDGPFFTKMGGGACSGKAIYSWFRKGLRRAGIPHLGGGLGPRLHDMRHTFAVHSLAKMADEGLDLYYSLPVLSTYLGHQSLEATDSYVRLTAEMYPVVVEAADKVCPYVFPGVR